MENDLRKFLLNFVDFTDEELDGICKYFKHKNLDKDEYLMNSGEVCSDFIFVKKGCIRMFYMSGDTEVSAWFSLKNSVAMEIQSFISELPSICYLQAIETSEVNYIPKKKLELLYQQYPKTQELMRKIWEAALVMVIPRFSSLQNDSAEKRYLNLLADPSLLNSIPQKYLASFIGVTPTSLSRIRRKIR